MQKKNIVFSVLISILSFLLIFLIIFYILDISPSKAKKKQIMESYRIYYNSKLATFQTENALLTDVQVVFLGDSLTDGYDLNNYYPEFKTANRGISGDTTIELEKRLKVSAFDLNPKVVVMLIGANNFDTMMDNYENILIKLKDNLKDSKFVLLSLTAMGKDWAKNNDKAILNNQQIKSLSVKYEMTFVDLFTPLCNPNTNKIYNEYTTDGGHLTSLGYSVLTENIKPILTNLLS